VSDVRPKLLIVSLGSIGQRHLRNTLKLLPNADIAVCRINNKTPVVAEVKKVFLIRYWILADD
jgi:hypothetical protein